MKAFFSSISTRNSSSDSRLSNYSLPPFPHPLPEGKLTIHITKDELIILPSTSTSTTSTSTSTHHHHHHHHHSHDFKDNRIPQTQSQPTAKRLLPSSSGSSSALAARIKWGRDASVQSISKNQLYQALQNQESDCEFVCYGIVGIVKLFNHSYLLVITSREFVGDFLHQSLPIYRCTGVLVIPLEFDQATTSIKTELNRQRSAPLNKTSDSSEEDSSSEEDDDVVTPSIISRNSFLSGSDSFSSRNSTTPTPGSATLKPSKNDPWLSSSNRPGRSTSEGGNDSLSEDPSSENGSNAATLSVDLPTAAAISAGVKDADQAEEDLKKIEQQSSVIPDQETETMTAEQRWNEATKAELEDKVIKETARQYSRGEMWFSYDFDITTPLQRKQETFDANAANARRGGSSASTSTTTSSSSTSSSTISNEYNQSKKRNDRKIPFDEPWKTLPLWRRTDRRFWHNENLSKPFVDSGLHAFVLPLMQGYFQITSLPIEQPTVRGILDSAGEAMNDVSSAANAEEGDSDSEEIEDKIEAKLLIVSRRSKERIGLRYQRRGINERGQVANFVETEQILLVKRLGSVNVLSFIQFRGSIPIYWGQSPFNLKPPPVLERNENENKKAFKKHFENQLKIYGNVICINLAEQFGKEGQITNAYKERVEDFNSVENGNKDNIGNENEKDGKEEKVKYVAFDFHKECAGMKFENVSKLLDQEKETLKEMNCFWRSENNNTSTTTTTTTSSTTSKPTTEILSFQKGAFRVSCLDCLDRTNVVQSAFARKVLLNQLERLGITPPILSTSEAAINGTGLKDEKFEFVFNDSWANNGDMVSQIYAGTRALKGDFTRTGKRNFLGMMNDATASVHRMVQGAVTDFFRQTVMDFHYGQTSLNELERYNHDLNMKDPTERNRLSRVRLEAISTCSSIVLNPSEIKLAGWTLFSPIEPNQIQSSKLEEKVVLLTNKAIYICGFDFIAEKLSEFSRILLGDVIGLKKGVYIISPNEGYDKEEFWGLILNYRKDEKRLNSASLRNVPPANKGSDDSATNFVAFRAIRADFAGTMTLPSESDTSSTAATSSTSENQSKNEKIKKGILGGNRFPSSKNPNSNGTSVKVEDLSVENKKKGVEFSQQHSSNNDNNSSNVTVGSGLSSHEIVNVIASQIAKQCLDAGACDEEDFSDFVKDETIQSLAQAKSNAPLFAPLIEGLKRRLWL